MGHAIRTRGVGNLNKILIGKQDNTIHRSRRNPRWVDIYGATVPIQMSKNMSLQRALVITGMNFWVPRRNISQPRKRPPVSEVVSLCWGSCFQI
jgi:hypothetical protein